MWGWFCIILQFFMIENNFIKTYVSLCMFVCICICGWVQEPMCACVLRSEFHTEYLPQSLSHRNIFGVILFLGNIFTLWQISTMYADGIYTAQPCLQLPPNVFWSISLNFMIIFTWVQWVFPFGHQLGPWATSQLLLFSRRVTLLSSVINCQ